MQATDRLYIETKLRIGPDRMEGVDRLLSQGHTGIAEAKTVEKLLTYIRGLEAQLGLEIKAPADGIITGIKFTERGVTHYV